MTVDCYTFTIPDLHKHKCGKCGTVWEHGSEAAGYGSKHSCPRCGEMEWRKYEGPEDVTSLVRDEYTFYLEGI